VQNRASRIKTRWRASTCCTKYVDRLPDSINTLGAVDELHGLLKSECFIPAAETGRIPTPDSTLALKRWWFDGGRYWLESYLKLPMQGELTKLRPHVVLPPDTRPTLPALIERDDPLRPLICRLDDDRCGVETLGWIQRAEQAFGAHRVMNPDSDTRLLQNSIQPTAPTPETASERCSAADALKQPLDVVLPAERRPYQTWRDCLEIQRPRTSALPLGRVTAPTAGWLIVTGRRGHYSFCDTTSAYDLATGAAFVHERCSGLRIVAGGEVDRALTDGDRSEKFALGPALDRQPARGTLDDVAPGACAAYSDRTGVLSVARGCGSRDRRSGSDV
jgi:hypothetical protein